MRLNLITFMMITVGALFVGTIAAFLLYVPVLTVATVSTIILALIVMFGLGVQAGGRRIRIKRPSAPDPVPDGERVINRGLGAATQTH